MGTWPFRWFSGALAAFIGMTVAGDILQWADPRAFGASVAYRFQRRQERRRKHRASFRFAQNSFVES